MILENMATIRLLGALVDSGPKGASRELLQQKTSLSTSSFYRVMKPLLHLGLVEEDGTRYNLPLSHPYNFLFKRLHGLERIEKLRKVERDRVLSVYHHARAHLRENLLALWLVGSAAHQTMHEDSDLDFLAVVRADSEYFPDRSYEVHFVIMTEEEFRARWAEKNDFVLTALRHGLLLEDCGFAQEFYSQPLPVQLKGEEFHQDEEQLAEDKERMMLFIKSKAPQETADALSRYAISLTRRMLRLYGILPAGKPELFRASELLLGEWFTQLLKEAVSGPSSSKQHWATEAVAKCHQLEQAFQRFSSHLPHLQRFAALVTGPNDQLEELGALAFRELGSQSLERRPARAVDLLLEHKRKIYVFEFKSLTGPCTDAPLRTLLRARDEIGHAVQLVLVVNPYRQIPILERKEPFSQEMRDLAASQSITLRTALDLLRFVNRLYFEPLAEPSALLEEFLHPPRNKRRGKSS